MTWSFLKVWQIGVERFGGVAGLPFGQRLHGHREHRAMHQRVAVGLGAGDLGGAKDAGCARLVEDDETLAELAADAVGQDAARGCRPTSPASTARPSR